MAVITVESTRDQRAKDIEDSLASGRMEGLQPSSGAMEIFQRYINGELTLEQMGAEIDEYAHREYGPIRLPGDLFAFQEHIVSSLDRTFEKLKAEQYLGGKDLQRFSNRGAYYLGEINAIHPFREGNGRTQREFMRALAVHNSWSLEWSRVSRDKMMEASKRSFRRHNIGLEHVLRSALDNDQNKRESGSSSNSLTLLVRD